MAFNANLLWIIGWLLAVGLLVVVGLRIAIKPRGETGRQWATLALFGLSNVLVIALAQHAILNKDSHLDLTRSKVFTPHEMAIELVDSLHEPVTVTYFGHEEDPKVKRLSIVLESLAKRSELLSLVVADPDKEPLLARRYQVSFYNVAVVEAAGRRVLVNTSNEVDIAIAIQKALRQRQTTICFVSGHGELAIDNDEFHTHVESLEGGAQTHHHGHAHIPVVQTTEHGVGRLRRSLEALGFVVSELNLTTKSSRAECAAIAIINPRFPFLPSEMAVIEAEYLAGSSIIILSDLGAELPVVSEFLRKHGIVINDDVVIDEKQHHEQDIETLAVSSYPSHVITKKIAMTLFPGTRSINIEPDAGQVNPLVKGSVYSRAHALRDNENEVIHSHGDEGSHIHPASEGINSDNGEPEPTIVVVKASDDGTGKLVVGGDADFVSNSYFPYLSNSSLALSIFRWAVGEQDEVRTEPTLPVLQTIVLSQPQMRLLFILLVGVMPLAVVLVGLFVWWKNRC